MRTVLILLAFTIHGCIAEPARAPAADDAAPPADDAAPPADAAAPPADTGSAHGRALDRPDAPGQPDDDAEPADPFAAARAELASCVPAEEEDVRWDEQDPGGLRVVGLEPLGAVRAGERLRVRVWLGNVSGQTFGWYPGLRVVSPDGPQDNWFYAIFACQRMPLEFDVDVPADLAPREPLILEAEAVTLQCAREETCGGHRVEVRLPVAR